MNVFQRIIDEIGSAPHHLGEAGWFHSVLVLAAHLYDYSQPDTHTNPVYEATHRLEQAGIGRPTLDKIKSILNDLDTKHRLGRF